MCSLRAQAAALTAPLLPPAHTHSQARLGDSNRNLAAKVLQLLGDIARAMGPPFDRGARSPLLLPAVANLSDNKKQVGGRAPSTEPQRVLGPGAGARRCLAEGASLAEAAAGPVLCHHARQAARLVLQLSPACLQAGALHNRHCQPSLLPAHLLLSHLPTTHTHTHHVRTPGSHTHHALYRLCCRCGTACCTCWTRGSASPPPTNSSLLWQRLWPTPSASRTARSRACSGESCAALRLRRRCCASRSGAVVSASAAAWWQPPGRGGVDAC